MTRFSRIRRRPDHWATPHERARSRAAERLDGPLGLAEAAWLEGHLASCTACAAAAAAYDADRLALRAMRDEFPQPPRDLWARTAAGIEREATARARTGRGGAARRADGGRGDRVPLAALSGLAVIAVVVSVSFASVGFGLFDVGPSGVKGEDPSGGGAAADASDASVANPTPMAVQAGAVAWIGGADGTFAYNDSTVDEVCPPRDPDCATLRGGATRRISQLSAAPRSVIKSSVGGQAIVEVDDDAGGQQLLVVALPEPTEPETASSPEPTSPASSPSAGVSPTPTSAATPSDEPSPAPSDPSASPEPSDTTTSPAPSDAPDPSTAPSTEPSSEPSPDPLATVEPSTTTDPSPTPEPTIAASLAIASGVELVGEAAAFSQDGAWFAFTARPADGSAGPDIHVWRVGDATSRQLTTDGRSVLASWDGGRVIASRPGSDDPVDGATSAVSVAIDPATGVESQVGDTWRPVVDPDGNRAVAWTGTVRPAADGTGWVPAEGRLELRAWSRAGGAGEPEGPDADAVIAEGPLSDFDVRWDESGEWFGVWVTDPTDPGIGRLSLHHVDSATGERSELDGAPVDVKALPGFSIGDGRLAWATPPGQGGEGSRIQIAAWDGDTVGTVESVPGEDIVVVR